MPRSRDRKKKPQPSARPAAPPQEDPLRELPGDDESAASAWSFAVVGIGASAGGLEAFTQLLHALPVDTGLAFVLIPHLSPSHASHMVEILGRATTMPVSEVQDEPTVEPNNVYVIPPDRSMVMGAGTLQLLPRKEVRGAPHPVDQFLQSLAQTQQHKAIGVILSGTANDGTLGLQEIKAAGGITFAQDDSAQYDGMPRSAIMAGCVDFVLPPDRIARELARIAQHAYVAPEPEQQTRTVVDEREFATILQLVHQGTGVDFSNYKASTLQRRIGRRMALHKIDELADYANLLIKQPVEIELLYQDILINVTSFFRDPESFDVLTKDIFPRLLGQRARLDPLRVWVLGCSTGEEAYSIAIAAFEYMEQIGRAYPLQLFATDLNGASVERARTGVYSTAITQHVSPERLRRYFQETEGGYRISKTVRDACIFARHNGLTDPPFSRVDLISCRNLLIYLEPTMQQRLVPMLHYAMKPNGVLWLGSSESTGAFRDLFGTLDAKHKFFVKQLGGGSVELPHVQVRREQSARVRTPEVKAPAHPGHDPQREAERVLLARYTPPGVLIDADFNVLSFLGDTGPFVAPNPGKATLNLFKMLREGLLVGVRAALARASDEHVSVRKEGLRVKTAEGNRLVDVEVMPVRGALSNAETFLVIFEDPAGPIRKLHEREPVLTDVENEHETTRLRQELAATKEYLQLLNEQQEAANEELQSSNEEVQSTNEELQSINEELETSKEEIQSSNEELATVNEELQNRNAELGQTNNDLINLLASVQMPILMLGPDLRIRRFTPHAEKLLRLIPSDVGRPIRDIKLTIDLSELETLALKVMEQVSTEHRDVRDVRDVRDGRDAPERWYSVRLRPYRTMDNRIDGVVVLFVDITAMKRTEDSLRTSEERLRVTTEQAPIGIFETDLEGRFIRVNDRFCLIVGRTREQLLRTRSAEITLPADQEADAEAFGRLKRGEASAVRIEKRYVHSAGPEVWVEIHRFIVTDAQGQAQFTVGLVQEIGERKARESRFRDLMDSTPVLIWMTGLEGTDYVNRAFLDFLGVEMPDVLGHGWERFIHNDDRERYRAAYQSAAARLQPLEHQFRLRRADGEYRWVLSVALPQFGPATQFIGFTGSTFDITDFKRAEEALRHEDQRKDEFIATLAHELRNPLAPIANVAHVLSTPDVPEETIAWAHEVLERQMRTIGRMVDDLLDVSRISHRKIHLQREAVDMGDLLERSIDAVRELVGTRRQHLLAELPTNPITVWGDPVRLEQVVGNLLNNASKFTPEGGHIWVTARSNPLEHSVAISVRDDGEGIDGDTLPDVFEMFRQADTSIARAHGGLGIGLSLVRRLVELHDGSVVARSDGVGKGSEFTVRLPLARPRLADEKGSGDQPIRDAGDGKAAPRRILIIDDNQDAAMSLAFLLKHDGHTVEVAHSGASGLEIARAYHPQVVLLDLGMPGMNGFDVARRLRDADGAGLLVIAISGYSGDDFARRAREAKIDHFLTKPVDRDKLRDVLVGG